METKSKRWIKEMIARFYYENVPNVYEIEKREFGVGDFGKKIVKRHLSFNDATFKAFLVDERPLFISHSTAYYEHPSLTPMQNKGFLYADLVFDLDAEGSFSEVKEDVIRLYDRLREEFGVKPYVNFSGNRGFHVHVRDRKFQSLLQDERKEIVDYLTLSSVDWSAFFHEEGNKVIGPSNYDRGIGRLLLDKVIEMAEKDWQSFSKKFKVHLNRDLFLSKIKEGNWSLFGSSYEVIMRKVHKIASLINFKTVNVDSGVSYDLSKLIRVPNSIHGETGFVAVEVNINDVEEFDRYRDPIFSFEEYVYVYPLKSVYIKPWDLRLLKGKKDKVLDYQALFLSLKGIVEIV